MFHVSARTVLELGSELISSDIIAFFELVKNGFDAKSKTGVGIQFDIVLGLRNLKTLQHDIHKKAAPLPVLKARCIKALYVEAAGLYADAESEIATCENEDDLFVALDEIASWNKIVVRDTGNGMSLKDLERKFLVIGTPSRKREVTRSIDAKEKKAPFLGEKGLGRLSAMRLGGTLDVRTAREKDTQFNRLKIDWTDFEDAEKMIEEIEVKTWSEGEKPESHSSGTELSIGMLESDWTFDRLVKLAKEEFALLTDPLADMKKRPRIKLVWNDKRIPIPSLEKKLLDVAHASVWGEYTVEGDKPRLKLTFKIRDLGFEHPVVDEVLNFGEVDIYSLVLGQKEAIPPEALITLGSFKFQAHWFNRQRLKASGGMDRDLIRKLQREWVGIRMYRDSFRVYPYGEERDDWLSLDRDALASKGYLLNKLQLVGQIDIGRNENPELIDQTNREGLRETPEQQVLLNLVKESVQQQMRLSMKRVESQYKEKRVKPVKAKTEIARLETRAKTAIKSLRSTTTNQESEVINELQQTLLELTELARILRERNAEVEDDAKLMQDMAGIGLLVEMVAHELARTSEHALAKIGELRKSSPQGTMGTQLAGLEASMKSIKARLKVLDPLTASGRQAPEKFSVTDLLTETLNGHSAQFKRHDIALKYRPPKQPSSLKTVKGYFVQVVENLIANSVYWLKLEKQKSPLFEPKISVEFLTSPMRIVVSDNGPGVDPGHKDHIFEMYFSLKESQKRRGLGLFISRSNAKSAGGSLMLDSEIKNSSGRLNTFVYCISENS
ncbi:ATP-binding protein [Falsihalocynthiibacter sp. CO-5D18]|uniref:sensor histidine kinase n=1 Tax=Falsihalocynthiibacter sp. CO-5D18 TaxID=3240872 RepID=UPI003510736C